MKPSPFAPRAGRSWQLFERALLVFKNPLSPTGPSRLLVSRAESCTARGCSCRDVSLKVISFEVGDFDFARAGLALEGLHSKFASSDAVDARLDIDLGLVAPDAYEGRLPLSEEWTAHLQAQIDGELLDLLNEQWLRAKGTVPSPTTDWPPRIQEELVGWDEAHPDDREDLYLDDDEQIIAEDLYCLKPACTCSEVRVAFRKTARGSPLIGSVRVRLPTGDVLARDSKSANAALLDRLWKAFAARHRVADRLDKRQQQMLDLGRLRAQARTPPPPIPSAKSVGRNDLCPCGSGKKYKRCCGA